MRLHGHVPPYGEKKWRDREQNDRGLGADSK
jgi:hypothetical protein